MAPNGTNDGGREVSANRTPEDELRAALVARQVERGETATEYGTDIGFADYLGVAKATWQHFKAGREPWLYLGVTLANGIVNRYPELEDLAIRCLLNGRLRVNRHVAAPRSQGGGGM